jgi:tetratricopeptide (TPR) repeat protein
MKTIAPISTRKHQLFDLDFSPAATTNPQAAREIASIRDWCLRRADEWYARGEYGAARDFLKQAADVDPQDAHVWVALGSLHYQLGEFERAGMAFLKAGELAPADDQVFLHLALTHQQLHQNEEAEALFKHAIALDPDNSLARSLLSSFLFSLERYDEARDYVEGALEEQPDDIELLMRLGACCYRTNDFHAAQACFERVLKLDASHVVARENLTAVAMAQN